MLGLQITTTLVVVSGLVDKLCVHHVADNPYAQCNDTSFPAMHFGVVRKIAKQAFEEFAVHNDHFWKVRFDLHLCQGD